MLLKGIPCIQYEYTDATTGSKKIVVQYLTPSGFDPTNVDNLNVNAQVSKDGLVLSLQLNLPSRLHEMDKLVNTDLPWVHGEADAERKKVGLENLAGALNCLKDHNGNLQYTVDIPLHRRCKERIVRGPEFESKTSDRFPCVILNLELEVMIQSLKNTKEEKHRAAFYDSASGSNNL